MKGNDVKRQAGDDLIRELANYYRQYRAYHVRYGGNPDDTEGYVQIPLIVLQRAYVIDENNKDLAA